MNPEISKRRTFAIISHPDAGKTTLTEKLLLYGGAIQLAGSVTARKTQRETASDWMELEKLRGISISSTLLQFDYRGWRMNLLDTPGHKDFSEDTYRVLMAVDSVIMIIDAAKGIESQTRKLFEICRHRKIPIFTFINKLDRPGKTPLELIDELETTLSIHAYPVNWPLGAGTDFRGVYDRLKREMHLYERVPGGAYMAPVSILDLSDPVIARELGNDLYSHAVEELEILNQIHGGFDPEKVLQGETTPVFFGSAANNFGVQILLERFIESSPPPLPRVSTQAVIPVDHPDFSGFIFKVQTNMNPLHRDRIAFMRVCSGVFNRDMTAFNTRTGKRIRLSHSHSLFGQNRETLDEAYPGDIVAFVAKPDLRIGDTISEDISIEFHAIPRFAPECFAFLNNPTPAAYKPFRRGLEQLLSENIVQVFRFKDPYKTNRVLLGCVGLLQFEVLQFRLKSEYGAPSELEHQAWKILRWVESPLGDDDLKRALPYHACLAEDELQRRVILFTSEWSANSFQNDHRNQVNLSASPFPDANETAEPSRREISWENA